MRSSSPNANGVLESGCHEIVATGGHRAFAAVNIALCPDGLYRCGVELHYSHGGFGYPITSDDPGYVSLDAARTAGLERLLRSWHSPFPGDPDSVKKELSEMRSQIELHLKQPSLF